MSTSKILHNSRPTPGPCRQPRADSRGRLTDARRRSCGKILRGEAEKKLKFLHNFFFALPPGLGGIEAARRGGLRGLTPAMGGRLVREMLARGDEFFFSNLVQHIPIWQASGARAAARRAG